MRVGYACVNTELPSAARTMRLANATPQRLREVTAANLDALALSLPVVFDAFHHQLRPALVAQALLRSVRPS